MSEKIKGKSLPPDCPGSIYSEPICLGPICPGPNCPGPKCLGPKCPGPKCPKA